MKRSEKVWRTMLPLAITVISGSCQDEVKEPARSLAADSVEAMQGSVREGGGRVFDPESLEVGDVVLGLRVARAQISRAYDSTDVGDVRFAGRIQVRGTPMWHHDHPEVDLLCFEVDSSSIDRLPRWPLDERRRVWFCFDNRDEALRQLGPPGQGRTVTIEIDDYQTVRHYSDEFDTARLIRVLE